MASTSRIPFVKAALTDRLAEAFVATDVQVTYGHPGKSPANEFVFIGDVTEWTTVWAAMGAQRRAETFSLHLRVAVSKPGNDQQEATERAFELLGLVEDALNGAHTDLGLVKPVIVNPVDEAEGAVGTQGRGTEISVNLECEARLSSGA